MIREISSASNAIYKSVNHTSVINSYNYHAGQDQSSERHEHVDEGADDEAVRLLAVGAEVPAEHLLQPAPVVDAVAQHHLLHGPPEVAVRVGGLDGQRRRPVERRRRTPPLLPPHLHDGARGVGLEEEPAVGPEPVDDDLVLVLVRRGRRRGEGRRRGGVVAVVVVGGGGVGRVHGRLVLVLLGVALAAVAVVVARGHDLRAVAAEGERPCLRARRPLPRRRRAEGGGGHGGGRGEARVGLAGAEEEGGERELLHHHVLLDLESARGECEDEVALADADVEGAGE